MAVLDWLSSGTGAPERLGTFGAHGDRVYFSTGTMSIAFERDYFDSKAFLEKARQCSDVVVTFGFPVEVYQALFSQTNDVGGISNVYLDGQCVCPRKIKDVLNIVYRAPCVTWLRLQDIYLTQEAVSIFIDLFTARAPTHTPITTLFLTDVLTYNSQEALCRILRHRRCSIDTLYLGLNVNCSQVLDSLVQNHTVKALQFNMTAVTQYNENSLCKLLQRNITLKRLNIECFGDSPSYVAMAISSSRSLTQLKLYGDGLRLPSGGVRRLACNRQRNIPLEEAIRCLPLVRLLQKVCTDVVALACILKHTQRQLYGYAAPLTRAQYVRVAQFGLSHKYVTNATSDECFKVFVFGEHTVQ